MKTLQRLLGGAKRTAVDLAEEIARVELDLSQLSDKLLGFAGRRSEMLRDDSSDADVDALEGEQRLAVRALDRCDLKLEELRGLHAEAKQRERVETIDNLYRAGLNHQAKAVALWAEYAAIAGRLREMAFLIRAHDEGRLACNKALREAGDNRSVDQAERVMSVRADGLYSDTLGRLVLPDPTDTGGAFWPPRELEKDVQDAAAAAQAKARAA
jgi:hypothetical protein